MKRLKKLFTLITLLVILIVPIATYANTGLQDYKIFIDGKPVEFSKDLGYPMVVNGRTLVPIRIISENMGYSVEWENSQQRVTISNTKTIIEFKISENNAIVNKKSVPIDTREENGKTVPVDTKAQLIGNRTYVPIRFISESMGATVDWKIEGKTLYVYIVRPGTTPIIPDIGTIPGTADYSENGYIENIKKVSEFFGSNLDSRMSGKTGASFNPTMGGTDSLFLYVVNSPGESYEAKVVIKDWYRPTSHTGIPTEEAYKKLNPTAKEVLRFYLPNGYDKLYQIIDDGYNWRWDDASKYVNKDISDLIGSDRPVKLIDGDGGLYIEIGIGK